MDTLVHRYYLVAIVILDTHMKELKLKRPDVIFRDGKPSAVIIDIDEYEAILEQLEEAEDIAFLKELRSKPMEFVSLNDLLKERPIDV